MASPFTFTPGKAGDAYIDMHYADEIIDNFDDPDSEKYVYKILGLKGSGKVSAEVKQYPDQHFYSDEAAVKGMIDAAAGEGYKVLVGIDDIAKTKDMVRFLSFFGDMVLDDRKDVYLLCTGTSKNIEDFADEPHLSFFVRSDRIETKGLSIPRMALKYEELLHVTGDEAKNLARYTKGYAYAYQVLGELCYKYKTAELMRVEPEFDAALADQYDIIWGQLSDCERELVKAIVSSESGEAKDIKSRISNSANYNAVRGRLNKKHLINTNERGILTIDLPRFSEYIDMWHTEQV